LVLDGLEPIAQRVLARRATEIGCPVVVDANHLEPNDGELVETADFLVASERFASRWTGIGELEESCRALLESGPDTVVLTVGDEGAVGAVSSGEELLWVPAYPVDVVEKTGAGDVFLGAFAYGVDEGWPLERSVRAANLAAGLSCTGIGARGSIPALIEVQEKLRSNV
jgi:sugar/nucleoside kinase (ribokinase family)